VVVISFFFKGGTLLGVRKKSGFLLAFDAVFSSEINLTKGAASRRFNGKIKIIDIEICSKDPLVQKNG
jgi:hypothetical protein